MSDLQAAVDDAPGDAPCRGRCSARVEELVAEHRDPPPDVVPGHVVEIALEVVDRLVEAVDTLEEGVGGVVHGTLEERGGLGTGLDACRCPVDRRKHPLRARLADRQDSARGRDEIELEVRGAPVAARHRVREHREHVPAVAFAARSDAAAVARRLGEDLDGLGVERDAEDVQELVPARVDEVGPFRRHDFARLAGRSAVAESADYDAETESAACRCSLSQRSASSAAAHPEPAAVTACR